MKIVLLQAAAIAWAALAIIASVAHTSGAIVVLSLTVAILSQLITWGMASSSKS